MHRPRFRLLVLALVASASCLAQSLQLTPVAADGVFPRDQPIAWTVTVVGDAAALGNPRYQIKLNGSKVIAEGTLDLTQPQIRIEAKPLSEPGTLLAEALTTDAANKTTKALGGAVVEPEKIHTVITRPADFDDFWKAQLDALAAVPVNVVLTAGESGHPDVEYFKVTFDNVDGAKIHAQMARPKKEGKFPAVVSTQWAGVYALNKSSVVTNAAQGWLAINVMAHDLPIDEKPEFYKAADAGALKDYSHIGNRRRETSYFRRMFLGNNRAAAYLAARPDWDGKTLVASGGSQGGYQSIVLAALEPRITAVIASIPAGCEITASVHGRANGWPGWWLPPDPAAREATIETSRYYDAVNFAPRVRVPVLVGLGLIDTTCPPTGVFAMTNQLAGPKEVVIHSTLGHKGPHPAHNKRSNAWMKALASGQPVPAKP
ncbi:MAG: acetylxylan esterase [Burkholderiales bacterium]|nr:acetylxylan esterase [Opitutaceae bacterium]